MFSSPWPGVARVQPPKVALPNHGNFHSDAKIFPTFLKGMMGVLLFHVVKRVFLLFHLKLAVSSYRTTLIGYGFYL